MIQYKWLLYCISAPCRYVTFCPLCYQHRGLLLNCKKKIQTNVWLHIDFLCRLIYNPSTGTNKRSTPSDPIVLLLTFPFDNIGWKIIPFVPKDIYAIIRVTKGIFFEVTHDRKGGKSYGRGGT